MKVRIKRGSSSLGGIKVGRPKKSVQALQKLMEPLSLPTVVSVPSNKLQEYVTLLYGEKKIGKTSLCSHMEGAFFLMCEPGGKSLALYQRPVTTWDEFTGYVRLIKKDTRFRTAVVDTVDLAYLYCTRAVCQRMGIEHPSDEEWGKGWNAVREEFTRQVALLLSSGKGVVFTSHAIEKEVKTRAGGKYDRIVPTMPGQARDVLEGLVDIWAYYHYDQDKRFLTILGDDHIGAGHRLTNHFLTPSGKRIRRIPMGTSSKEAYQNFMKAFHNQLGV